MSAVVAVLAWQGKKETFRSEGSVIRWNEIVGREKKGRGRGARCTAMQEKHRDSQSECRV